MRAVSPEPFKFSKGNAQQWRASAPPANLSISTYPRAPGLRPRVRKPRVLFLKGFAMIAGSPDSMAGNFLYYNLMPPPGTPF
eukprot:717993-Hanusia_phi.AAC.8